MTDHHRPPAAHRPRPRCKAYLPAEPTDTTVATMPGRHRPPRRRHRRRARTTSTSSTPSTAAIVAALVDAALDDDDSTILVARLDPGDRPALDPPPRAAAARPQHSPPTGTPAPNSTDQPTSPGASSASGVTDEWQTRHGRPRRNEEPLRRASSSSPPATDRNPQVEGQFFPCAYHRTDSRPVPVRVPDIERPIATCGVPDRAVIGRWPRSVGVRPGPPGGPCRVLLALVSVVCLLRRPASVADHVPPLSRVSAPFAVARRARGVCARCSRRAGWPAVRARAAAGSPAAASPVETLVSVRAADWRSARAGAAAGRVAPSSPPADAGSGAGRRRRRDGAGVASVAASRRGRVPRAGAASPARLEASAGRVDGRGDGVAADRQDGVVRGTGGAASAAAGPARRRRAGRPRPDPAAARRRISPRTDAALGRWHEHVDPHGSPLAEHVARVVLQARRGVRPLPQRVDVQGRHPVADRGPRPVARPGGHRRGARPPGRPAGRDPSDDGAT